MIFNIGGKMEVLKELEEKVDLILEKYKKAQEEIAELKNKLKKQEMPNWNEEKEELIKKLESLLEKLKKVL